MAKARAQANERKAGRGHGQALGRPITKEKLARAGKKESPKAKERGK